MTKIEKQRCEKLIEEAKINLNHSNKEYKEYLKTQSILALRNAQQDYGYAVGIYRALVVIGYSSVSMKELTERI